MFFLSGPFLKSLLSLLQQLPLFYVLVLVFWPQGIWDLSSWPRIKPTPSALEGSLNPSNCDPVEYYDLLNESGVQVALYPFVNQTWETIGGVFLSWSKHTSFLGMIKTTVSAISCVSPCGCESWCFIWRVYWAPGSVLGLCMLVGAIDTLTLYKQETRERGETNKLAWGHTASKVEKLDSVPCWPYFIDHLFCAA